MIRRLHFLDPVEGRNLSPAWPDALAGALAAPPGVRPVRAAACPALALVTPTPHAAVGVAWFDDEAHLVRYERWLTSAEGDVVAAGLRAAGVDLGASPVVAATEHVLRGADWLDARWRDGGDKVKHLALARRAAGLAPAEFAERWRGHAGTAGGAVIPDAARGRAYVQDHPLRPEAADPVYDAVTEVYFDDVDAARARIDWFAQHPEAVRPGNLFGSSRFLLVREELLSLPPG